MAVKGPRESVVEKALIARVEALGGMCIKVHTIGHRGFFDRLIILPGGRIIFCEVKRPSGGRMAVHQVWYAHEIKMRGGEVALISSVAQIDQLLPR